MRDEDTLTSAILDMLRDLGSTPDYARVSYDGRRFYYGGDHGDRPVIYWRDIAGGQWEPDEDWTDEDFEDAALALTVWCSERESEWVVDANNEEN